MSDLTSFVSHIDYLRLIVRGLKSGDPPPHIVIGGQSMDVLNVNSQPSTEHALLRAVLDEVCRCGFSMKVRPGSSSSPWFQLATPILTWNTSKIINECGKEHFAHVACANPEPSRI